MASEKRIDLQEALEGNPQIQTRVTKLENEATPLKEYSLLLRDTFQACHIHQLKVCEGTDALVKLLNSFPVEHIRENKGPSLSRSFSRLGRYLSELHSCQEMLSTQLQNAVIDLLSQFISTDFSMLEKLKEGYDSTWQDHEQAMAKYSRVSKRKDSEKASFDANSDLYTARKKCYQSSLEYYSELNCLQYKKKLALLEPLLTFMHAQMAYFKVGHEILNKDLGKLLTELNTDVQREHTEYQKEVQAMAEENTEIALKLPHLCHPDPDPADPFANFHPPDVSLCEKSGHLFFRIQKTGFPSKWERGYFYIKKGYLYLHLPQKSPEIYLHLKGAEATAADIDDRRNVIQVTHPTHKRPLYLLAENQVLRDEWIATIGNVGVDKGSAAPSQSSAKDAEVIRLERERIRSWVNREIQEPGSSKKEKGSLLKSLTSSSQLQPPPAKSGSGTKGDVSPQRKSPILHRKASKQRKSDASSVGLVSPPAGSSEHAQLPPPLQPEKVPSVGSKDSTPSLNGSAGSKWTHHFSQTFSVKYLGHTEVQDSKGASAITETIRKVMAARSMKNIKSAQGITITITHKAITLADPGMKRSIGQIQLKDILRCAVHQENTKLFGIVNRTAGDLEGKSKFICHVLEAERSGMNVCAAINSAIQAAYKNMQSKHSRSLSATPASTVSFSLQPPDVKDQVDGDTLKSAPQLPMPARPIPPGGYGDYETGYFSTDMQVQEMNLSTGTVSVTRKSASESNLQALAAQPLPSSATSGLSSSDYISADTPANGSSNGYQPQSTKTSAWSDDSSSNDQSSLFILSDDTPTSSIKPAAASSSTAMPTLFEGRRSQDTSKDGYYSSDPFVIDSPTDSLNTPDLTTEEAANTSGYFPMPTILGGTQPSLNKPANQSAGSSNGLGPSVSGGYYKSSSVSMTPSLSFDAYKKTPTNSTSGLATVLLSTVAQTTNSTMTTTSLLPQSAQKLSTTVVTSIAPLSTLFQTSTAQTSSSFAITPTTSSTSSSSYYIPSTVAASMSPFRMPQPTTSKNTEDEEEYDLGEPVDLLGDFSDDSTFPPLVSNSAIHHQQSSSDYFQAPDELMFEDSFGDPSFGTSQSTATATGVPSFFQMQSSAAGDVQGSGLTGQTSYSGSIVTLSTKPSSVQVPKKE